MAFSVLQDDGQQSITAGAKPASRDADAPPRSVVPVADGLSGLAGLTLTFTLVMVLRPNALIATWLVLLATAVPMLARELRRAPAAPRRQAVFALLPWLAGFAVATLPFLLIHAQDSGLLLWGSAWVVIAPAFALRLVIEVLRGRQPPGAGFPLALGRFLMHPAREGLEPLAGPARLWTLKAFFIPLYAVSLYGLMIASLRDGLNGPLDWLALAVAYAFTIDLAFGLSGYLFANNELVPTIRSTQTRIAGWVVCICCYGPFVRHWPDFQQALVGEITWPHMVTASPLVLASAAVMLIFLALYVSATVVFGLRFSNLANRGLIASGPYRLMKHPAYFAHACNAWIITFIFLPASGVTLDLGQMLVPLAFTVIYPLRALTEERHMSEDADYVAYAEWISRNGLVAKFRRLISGALGRP